MKKIIFSCIVLFFLNIQAQQLPNRYLEETSSSFQIEKDVVFSTNIPTVKSFNLFGNRLANEETYGDVKTTLKMNIYKPTNDTLTKRPVIIFAFGGGFVNGSRTEKSMIKLCEAFAKRGFVTATIDYRLGMNIGDKELSKRAVYRALQDGRSAVRFFRKNASSYGVDPNQIYISGHSAGAFLAYQSVYLDKDFERPLSTRNYFGRADLGGLDAIGDNKLNSNGSVINGKANGVMGFAGALGDVTYIENATDVPGVYFHSSNDNTVPFNSGEPFSSISWLPGFNLPTVYGSNVMNSQANIVNAAHSFYPYTSRGHNVHFNGSNLYPDIAPNGAQYFYDALLKPNQSVITGAVNVCQNCPPQNYTVSGNAFYYDWQVSGGTFTSVNPYSNTVSITWDASASIHTLAVTPYSRQLARGTSSSLEVSVNGFSKTINASKLFSDTNTVVGPNPFSEHIQITISNDYLGEIEFTIIDVTGKIIGNRKIAKNAFTITENFSDEFKASGFYFVKVVADNEDVITKKLYRK